MSARSLLFVAPPLLLSLALGAAASCLSEEPGYHPPDDSSTSGGGGGTTSSSGATSSSGTTTSSGTKSSSSTTTSSGTGGAALLNDGQKCAQSAECLSGICSGTPPVCQVPTCTDKVKNGAETDLDCGGPTCPPCADSAACLVGRDCMSHVCDPKAATCQAATCMDKVQNGNETDVDCGGAANDAAPACPPCNVGQNCGANTDCVFQACQGTCLCPTGMATVQVQGGGGYCIQTHEVTYGEYKTFLIANVSFASQSPACQWNMDWTPASAPITASDVPVSVNWCQADAYCRYQKPSMHLCGTIGGGIAALQSFADFHKDAWFNACSQQGNFGYAYGNDYRPALCNGKDGIPSDAGVGPGSATTWPQCGPADLLDMSGNVAEWEDACDQTSGPDDMCAVRGGSYLDDAAGLRCDSGQSALPVTRPRNYKGLDVGFRCCL